MRQTIKRRFSFPVGMRIVKTALAAFLCMVVDYLRGQIPFQSIVTTTLCIQPDQKGSLHSAISRAVGTLVGAIMGILVYLLFSPLGERIHILLYYFLVAIFVIPTIYIDSKLKVPQGVQVSMVVYVSITLMQTTASNTWIYAIHRMVDTLVGIFVALPVNLLLPLKKPEEPVEVPRS